MVVSILLALISRQRFPMAIALAVFFTGQISDAVAGAQTGVNVFITYIGMALVAAQLVVMWVSGLRESAAILRWLHPYKLPKVSLSFLRPSMLLGLRVFCFCLDKRSSTSLIDANERFR